jgi:hypothetical protein
MSGRLADEVDATVTALVEAEVEHQHRLLASWLGSPAQPEVLDALRACLTRDFAMVTVGGQVVRRSAVLDELAGAGHAHPGLRILTSEVTLVARLGDAVLVRYLRTHVEHRHTSSRQVSALLQADEQAPHGLRWRYLHETAIPE